MYMVFVVYIVFSLSVPNKIDSLLSIFHSL